MGNSGGGVRPKVCQRCGRTYCGGGYKFCSRECMLGAGVCKRCGKEFQRGFTGQRFCKECHGKAEDRTCPGCGKVFSSRYGQAYCSKGCYESARARVPERCPTCGKEVPKGRRYCSDECKYRANGSIHTCQHCGREFHGVRHNGRDRRVYCSKECQEEGQRQAQRKRAVQVCQTCGKEFYPHNMAKGLFCSRECSGVSLRTRSCQVCGKWISSGRYCSERCRAEGAKRRMFAPSFEEQFVDALEWMARLSKAIVGSERTLIAVGCSQCGAGFLTTSEKARFCSDRCRRRHANRAKDERIYWYGEPDLSITLDKLFVRDRGTCVSCGMLMTFSSPPNSDEYPSIDHIVPLSKGGTHTWDNVQLMCRGCNASKLDSLGWTLDKRRAWFEA